MTASDGILDSFFNDQNITEDIDFDDLLFDQLVFNDAITAQAEVNEEDLDDIDAAELAEALGLLDAAEDEAAGLTNLSI